MNETIACPGCQAELVLPMLPEGQTVKCPRCQHIFEPFRQRAVPAPSAPVMRPIPAYADNDPYDDAPNVTRYLPLTGEWKSFTAMILLGFSAFSYCVQLYVNVERNQVTQLNNALFDDVGRRIRVHDGVRLAELNRRSSNLENWSQFGSILHFVTYWPAVVFVLMWVNQAGLNLRILRTTGLTFTPASATVSFLIPFANLFQPYVAVQEIWRASDPNATRDARSWQHSPGSALVLVWWLSLITAAGLALLNLWTDGFQHFDVRVGGAPSPNWIVCLSNVAMIAAGVALIAVIRGIRIRQQQRHAKIYDEAG